MLLSSRFPTLACLRPWVPGPVPRRKSCALELVLCSRLFSVHSGEVMVRGRTCVLCECLQRPILSIFCLTCSGKFLQRWSTPETDNPFPLPNHHDQIFLMLNKMTCWLARITQTLTSTKNLRSCCWEAVVRGCSVLRKMPQAAVHNTVSVKLWLGSWVHELVFQIYHQKNVGRISFLFLLPTHFFSSLRFILPLFMCVSIFYCVYVHDMTVGTHRDHERTLDPQSWSYRQLWAATQYGCSDLNSSSLQVLLSTEPFLQPSLLSKSSILVALHCQGLNQNQRNQAIHTAWWLLLCLSPPTFPDPSPGPRTRHCHCSRAWGPRCPVFPLPYRNQDCRDMFWWHACLCMLGTLCLWICPQGPKDHLELAETAQPFLSPTLTLC